MWETIGHVLTGPNTTSVLMFLGLVIIVAVLLMKSGLIQVHTSSVQIGAADTERNIIRQQLEYVQLHFKGVEGSLKKPEGYNEWLGRFIFEKIYDEYVNWITLNHINKSPSYIKLKQESLISLVQHYTIMEDFKNSEFEEFIRKDTEQMIKDLIEIRELYSK